LDPDSESRIFSAGVGVWSPKYSNPGVEVKSLTSRQGLRIPGQNIRLKVNQSMSGTFMS